MSEIGDISWNARLETYFASSGEKAHALSLLHKRCEALYSARRTLIDLPVIVGSAVIGFLNAGSSSMFSDPMISSVALGVGSLVVGILQTVNTYFAWAKRAEGHRIASIQYGKLFRYLSIEMSLPREERKTPSDLLSHTRETFDRLTEISPLLPEDVIAEFKVKFRDYKDVARPEEANGLEKIEVYVEGWTKENPLRDRLRAVGVSEQLGRLPSATSLPPLGGQSVESEASGGQTSA
jgi:hypothetical protein